MIGSHIPYPRSTYITVSKEYRRKKCSQNQDVTCENYVFEHFPRFGLQVDLLDLDYERVQVQYEENGGYNEHEDCDKAQGLTSSRFSDTSITKNEVHGPQSELYETKTWQKTILLE